MKYVIIYQNKTFVNLYPFGKIKFVSKIAAKDYLKKIIKRNKDLKLENVKKGDLLVLRQVGTPVIVEKKRKNLFVLINLETLNSTYISPKFMRMNFTPELKWMKGKFKIVSVKPYIKKNNDFE